VVRALAPLVLAVAVVACSDRDALEFGAFETRKTDAGVTVRTERKTASRVIDQAGKCSSAEQGRIDREAVRVGKAIDRAVVVLTVPPLGKETLEHFGWAINGQRRDGGTVMLMVRPDERTVRVDSGGSVTPEQAAQVAAAMQPALRQDNVASAVQAGLAMLEKVVGAKAG